MYFANKDILGIKRELGYIIFDQALNNYRVATLANLIIVT